MSATISNSLKWKRRLGWIATLLPSKPTERSVILIYHSVGSGPLATKTEKFRSQMAWLSENADVVSLSALLESSGDGSDKLKVALTFDDGYLSVYDTAAPVLADYGFPATVYVNSGHINDVDRDNSDISQGHYPQEQFMLWNEVLQLQKQGWAIGSHGVHHYDLTQQSEQLVFEELAESRRCIEERTLHACDHFSYTWGRSSLSLRVNVGKTGYRTAVGGVHGALSLGDDCFNLPRLDIRREYAMQDFIAVVSGKWDFLQKVQRIKALLQGGLHG